MFVPVRVLVPGTTGKSYFAESRETDARQRRTFAERQVRRSAKASLPRAKSWLSAKASFAESSALGKEELSAKSLAV